MSFAKLYGPDEDQILVMLSNDEERAPEVRVYFQPKDLGLCSTALKFPDTDSGWDKAEAAFAEMNEEKARRMVSTVLNGIGLGDING